MRSENGRPRAYSYVRMSTPEQRKGDSLRRQREASARYAAKNSLEIIEGDGAYEDIGVSAFKGKNLKAGALGQFLEAVRAGKINRGSYLLVESLDRVSRETTYDADATMRQIVEEGINVVDLSDNERLYSTAVFRSDSQAYMRMLVRFERAHDESKIKSDRVREAWKAKRQAAKNGLKMTRWCPAWLKLSKDKTRYELIERNAETVRWIFNEAAEGRGIFTIARRLNASSFAPFGKSRGWHPSYVIKILKNRSVLGEYRPTRVGGRVATLDDREQYSIQNYYPPIVGEELFFRVQQALASRRVKGAGRKGSNFTNLFTGIKIRCAYCGGSVRFENKGSGPKGGLYLVCDDARRGHNCRAERWRYQHFEDSFLSFVHHEIDSSTFTRGEEDDRRAALGNSIEALMGRRADLIEQRRRRIQLVDMLDDPTAVAPQIDALSRDINELGERILRSEQERAELNSRATAMMAGPQHLKELLETLSNPAADTYAMRSRLAQSIRQLVSEIILGAQRRPIDGGIVLPNGEHVDEHDSLEWAKDEQERQDATILLGRLFNFTDSRAYYAVRFKNDELRIDVPPENPRTQPAEAEKTTAMVFIFEDGSAEIVELADLDENIAAPKNDANAPLLIAAGYVTSNRRTGSVSR